ncbi:MAG: urease accessory protein UreD [Gallionellaceae bacterium]
MQTTVELNPSGHAAWEAELILGFSRRDARSLLTQRSHRGPLVVQKSLHPEGEGICHAIILHPPGGVAGGDRLKIQASVGEGAHALLTTPGAGKWYKANGAEATQKIELSADEDAVLEWLPQENILYDAAQVTWDARVDLAESARYAGWEITCFGRQACGEQFREGKLRQSLQIYRASRLIWGEHASLQGGDKLLSSPAGLRGCPVSATFVVAAGVTPAHILESCRAVVPSDAGRVGVTALPEVFVGRYLGHSAQEARHYFEALWAILRPTYASAAAQRPRIWNT